MKNDPVSPPPRAGNQLSMTPNITARTTPVTYVGMAVRVSESMLAKKSVGPLRKTALTIPRGTPTMTMIATA